jgi:hypothetical protein
LIADQSGRRFCRNHAVLRGLVNGLADVLHLFAQPSHLRLNEQVSHPDQFLNVTGPYDDVGKFEGRQTLAGQSSLPSC